MQTVKYIRNKLAQAYHNEEFVVDKSGTKLVEIISESFIANEDYIFGLPNRVYIQRELEWYKSMSLNVNDIPGETPKIWKQVATPEGTINSNYGWMIFSNENYSQYNNVKEELLKQPSSRRATMIYQRPSMWLDYNKDGMSDFCCTYSTQHFIRNKKLITCVFMRSNDTIFGYRNDIAWHQNVTNSLYNDLKDSIEIESTEIIWTAGSLHVYESQFYLLDHYVKTGEAHITLSEYNSLYK